MITRIRRTLVRNWRWYFTVFSLISLLFIITDYNLNNRTIVFVKRRITSSLKDVPLETKTFPSSKAKNTGNKIITKQSTVEKEVNFDPKKSFTRTVTSTSKKEKKDNIKISKIETEKEFIKRMEKRMETRKDTLEKACHLLDYNHENTTYKPWSLRIPEPRPWVFVSKKYKLLYTEIPKSGCTNWKKVMMVLNGLVNSTDNVTQVQAHLSKVEAIRRKYVPKKYLDIYQQSTTLLVVRDPLERLVSAYVDKVMRKDETNSSIFDKFSFEVAKKYGSRWKDNEKVLKNGVREISVCQDYGVDLRCEDEDHVIKIINATYGQPADISESSEFDSRRSGKPCSNPLANFITSQLCDGRQKCSVVASGWQFGLIRDCEREKKVLTIRYVCTPITNWNMVTVCSGFSHTIKCPRGGVIMIGKAFYGRKNKKTCSFRSTMKVSDCDSPTATSAVISACNNKSSCVVIADSVWIQSDSCPTTSKYLQVWYSCVAKDVKFISGFPTEFLNNKEVSKNNTDEDDGDLDDNDDNDDENDDEDDKEEKKDSLRYKDDYITYYAKMVKNFQTRKILTEKKNITFMLEESQLSVKLSLPIIYSPNWVYRKYHLSATFEEFVSYLLDPLNFDVTNDVIDYGSTTLKSTSVRHWQPYYSLAYPCHVYYDVIVHIETIEEDARYLLHRIGAPKSLHYPHGYNEKSGKSSTSKKKVKKFISTLNSTLKRNLINLYSPDYKLFGYEIPSYETT